MLLAIIPLIHMLDWALESSLGQGSSLLLQTRVLVLRLWAGMQ